MSEDEVRQAARRAPRPGAAWPWALLAAVAASMAIAYWQGLHRHISLESLIAHEAMLRDFVDANFAGAIAAYAALYVAVVALSLPGGLALTMAGGFLFGWLAAGPVTVVAATAGAVGVFLIARTTLGDTLARRAGPRLLALRQGFQRDALSYLLFLRLVPAFPFWLVNLAPALLGVPLGVFVLGTFLGIIPGTFAFAIVGAGLDSVVAAHRDAFERCLAHAADPGACSLGIEAGALLTRQVVVAFAALGALALVPVVAKKVFRRHGDTPTI